MPVGSRRRLFLATSGTFAMFVGYHAGGGTGKPAVAYEAARSHARAALLLTSIATALRAAAPGRNPARFLKT